MLASKKSQNSAKKLDEIRDEVIALKTELANERRKNNTYAVIGEGNTKAKIMLIGEAPGKNEAKTGKPFCGASGKFLDTLLESINLDRKTVYITNLVKDRPPENRDPTSEEINEYGNFLKRQIEIIKPKIIVTLGRLSMKYIFEYADITDSLAPISKIHGQNFKTKVSYGEINIIAMYHPAVALYNGSNRQVLLNDFQNIKSLLV